MAKYNKKMGENKSHITDKEFKRQHHSLEK